MTPGNPPLCCSQQPFELCALRRLPCGAWHRCAAAGRLGLTAGHHRSERRGGHWWVVGGRAGGQASGFVSRTGGPEQGHSMLPVPSRHPQHTMLPCHSHASHPAASTRLYCRLGERHISGGPRRRPDLHHPGRPDHRLPDHWPGHRRHAASWRAGAAAERWAACLPALPRARLLAALSEGGGAVRGGRAWSARRLLALGTVEGCTTPGAG